MDPRTRKLLQFLLVPEQDPSAASSTVSHTVISSNTSSAPSKRPDFNQSKINNKHSFNSNGAASCTYGGFNAYRLSQPFDYSMALTVLGLLTALFFIGFLSIYIRRFSDNSSVDLRFRRRLSAYSTKARGVNPDMVDSLPMYRYDGGAKMAIATESECAICLSEFEEGECVKAIPFCRHVFHVDCIDTWLASHVTCPLCRTAKLFPEEAGPVAAAEGGELSPETAEVRVAISCDASGSQQLDGLRSTVDMADT